jgi:hypothetical protein
MSGITCPWSHTDYPVYTMIIHCPHSASWCLSFIDWHSCLQSFCVLLLLDIHGVAHGPTHVTVTCDSGSYLHMLIRLMSGTKSAALRTQLVRLGVSNLRLRDGGGIPSGVFDIRARACLLVLEGIYNRQNTIFKDFPHSLKTIHVYSSTQTDKKCAVLHCQKHSTARRILEVSNIYTNECIRFHITMSKLYFRLLA